MVLNHKVAKSTKDYFALEQSDIRALYINYEDAEYIEDIFY